MTARPPSYLHPMRFRAATAMRTFDLLPPAVRDALNDAPINLDARKVRAAVAAQGEARVLAAIGGLGEAEG